MQPLRLLRVTALPVVILALTGVASRATLAPVALDGLADLVAQARTAGAACDFEEERKVLARAERLDGLAAQKVEVQCRLALLEWRLDGEPATARRRLERASGWPAPHAAWRTLARLESAEGDHPAARVAARAAVRTAESADERLDARLAFASAAVDEALALRRAGETGEVPDLREAFRDVRALVARGEGGREAARLLVRTALLGLEGRAALEGLRSYFAASSGTPPNLVAEPLARLERSLPVGLGAEASADERRLLVAALADARLFVEAALVALDPRAPEAVRADPEVAAVLAYERYLKDVLALADEAFGLRARGERDRGKSEREFGRRTALLDAELRGRTSARAYGAAMLESLQERFGLWTWSGPKAGTFDLHLGHAVQEDEGADEGERRVVLVDLVVAGYRDWCGGTDAGAIEWSTRDAAVRVR